MGIQLRRSTAKIYIYFCGDDLEVKLSRTGNEKVDDCSCNVQSPKHHRSDLQIVPSPVDYPRSGVYDEDASFHAQMLVGF